MKSLRPLNEEKIENQELTSCSYRELENTTKFYPQYFIVKQLEDSPIICFSKISDDFRRFLTNPRLLELIKEVIIGLKGNI